MTPQEIKEGNRILHVFMGHPEYMPITDGLSTTLGYNNDWERLMGVIDKIESLEGCEVIISKYLIEIYKNNLRKSHSKITTTKIEAVYEACVQFVKWYGQNKGGN